MSISFINIVNVWFIILNDIYLFFKYWWYIFEIMLSKKNNNKIGV